MYDVNVTLTCDECGAEISDCVTTEETRSALNLIRDITDREQWELWKSKVLCYDCARSESELDGMEEEE